MLVSDFVYPGQRQTEGTYVLILVLVDVGLGL